MKTGFSIKGTITLEVERVDGSAIKAVHKNIVTKWGLSQVASFLAGAATSAPLSSLALGTGATPASEADIKLETEALRDTAVINHLTGADSSTVELRVAHALGAVSGTFTEAGIFNASAANSGNMFNRVVFAAFPVTASDTLTVIWKIEVKNI